MSTTEHHLKKGDLPFTADPSKSFTNAFFIAAGGIQVI